MVKKQSAGLLLFRRINNFPEVFLVHPGGPFWKNKDAGAWSIPKGEFTENELPLDAAVREFCEETGMSVSGEFIELSPVVLKSGKKVYAWAIEKNIDEQKIVSNTFEIEWPPRSGIYKNFPEVDRANWFSFEEAIEKINVMQAGLIRDLQQKISV